MMGWSLYELGFAQVECGVAHKNWGWLNWEGSSEELWLAQVGWGVAQKNSE